jgi:MoaA/NifB/PqqE/SkfB family radical SAM enzyme
VIGWRRQYADVVRGRLARGDLLGLASLAARWIGTALAPRLRRPLVGPALGTLMVTYRCNLRCRVCDLPDRAVARRKAGDRELSTRELRRVLDDFHAIGTLGVGVTGGEPMLRDDLFELLGHGSRRGLHMHLNTDGFRVDAAAARAIVAAGVRSVNVSLDGATAAQHDFARGRVGAFRDATAALAALRAARGSHRGDGGGRRETMKLTAITVLTSENVDRIEDVANVALSAGADRVGVIPVHDFGQGEPAAQAEKVVRGGDALRRLRARGVLDNSLAYLDLVPRALRGEPSPLRCYAPYASVVVDCYGDVFPCFPFMERKRPIGRLPLAPLWRSAAYQRERERLEACRDCLWNCHTEMNLVLPQGKPGRARSTGERPAAAAVGSAT